MTGQDPSTGTTYMFKLPVGEFPLAHDGSGTVGGFSVNLVDHVPHPPPWHLEPGQVQGVLQLIELDEAGLLLVQNTELLLQLTFLVVSESLE